MAKTTADANYDKQFWMLFSGVLDRVEEIAAQRKVYDTSVSMRDKFLYGDLGIMQHVWQKVMRLRVLVEDEGDVDDSIFDCISYIAMLYAHHKLRVREEIREAIADEPVYEVRPDSANGHVAVDVRTTDAHGAGPALLAG